MTEQWVPIASNTDSAGAVYTDARMHASANDYSYRFRFVPLVDGGFRIGDEFSVAYSDERFAPCHAPSWWLSVWPRPQSAEWIVR